jgi:hypothetical protein
MANLKIIQDQEFKKQFLFLITCLGRTKDLYSLFKDEIKNDDFDYSLKFRNAPEKIDVFYSECLSVIFGSQKNFETDFNRFYELAPSYEEYSTVYSTIATQIALMCTSIGEFFESQDIGLINEVLTNLEEVINIIKSEEFYLQNREGDIQNYVEAFLKKEYIDQLEILKEIRSQDFSREGFQKLIDEYEVKF